VKEFQIINQIFKDLAKNSDNKKSNLNLLIDAKNLCDDTAEIRFKKNQIMAISKDIFVEDIHFRLTDDVEKIAAKLLTTNLSDLASTGATPICYLFGFGKSEKCNEKFLKSFARGLKKIQDQYNISLIGGDTVKSKNIFFSITIFGVKNSANILDRSNGQENDLIFVSGNIGDAFLGLNLSDKKKNFKKKLANLLSKKEINFLEKKHFEPTARVELGNNLAKLKLANAAIDVSDGLIADLNHICISSNLEAEIDLEKIPLSLEAKKILKNSNYFKISDLISAGDDYELVFTAAEKNQKKISQLAKKLNIKITNIGKMKKNFADKKTDKNQKNHVSIFQNNKKITLSKFGYEH
jgi:thiamine-monophosphate kinase